MVTHQNIAWNGRKGEREGGCGDRGQKEILRDVGENRKGGGCCVTHYERTKVVNIPKSSWEHT